VVVVVVAVQRLQEAVVDRLCCRPLGRIRWTNFVGSLQLEGGPEGLVEGLVVVLVVVLLAVAVAKQEAGGPALAGMRTLGTSRFHLQLPSLSMPRNRLSERI